MADLSPAAQAVLDEVLYRMSAGESDSYAKLIAAAALRAAVDQVVPPVNEADIARVENRVGTVYVCGSQDARRRIRAELLALATELEAQ